MPTHPPPQSPIPLLLAPTFRFCYSPDILGVAGRKSEWPWRYREFVETGLAESDAEFEAALKVSPRCIGGDAFRAWVDNIYEELLAKHSRPEDVSFRHTSQPLPANDVLAALAELFSVEIGEFRRRRHGSALRAVASRFLIRYAGLSQRDVADLLSMGSGSAVCNQLKALPAKLAGDRRLARRMREAEARLERQRHPQA